MSSLKKFFVLVPKTLKPTFLRTKVSANRYMDLNPFQKQFIFDSEDKAKQFYGLVENCKSDENFKKIELDYRVQQYLQQYEDQLKGKQFRRDYRNSGISIPLEKTKTIYVLIDGNQKPRVYYSAATANKNLTTTSQLKRFLDQESALSYLKDVLEKQEIEQAQQEGNQITSEQQAAEQESANSIRQQELGNLDREYQFLIDQGEMKALSHFKVDTSEKYCMQCGYFNTIHFHSAIGLTLANLGGRELKTCGFYAGQKKPYFLALFSVFYGLRYSLLLNLPQILIQTTDRDAFEYIKKMREPKFQVQRFLLDGISAYSKLMKNVEFEIVDDTAMQVAQRKAIYEFQKQAYIKDRSKKSKYDGYYR